MAVLSATFKLIDQMSDKFEAMANSGEQAFERWERAGEIGGDAFEKTAKAAEQVAKAMDTASEASDNWTDKIGNYDKGAMEAIYSTEELVEQGFKTAEALEAEADAADDAADRMSGLGDKFENLGDDIDDATEPLKKYEDSVDGAKNATEMLGDALTTIGVAQLLKEIAEAANECVNNFQEYQTAVATVDTLADTSVKSIGDISSEIMTLSGDVGRASSDIADATYQAISAGVETASSVDFVREANELAVGGFTATTTAVDVLTTSLNAYGLEVDKTSQIADYLITTQNLGKTTVDQLAASVGKVIPIAAAYGVEMDNLSTAYAVLTANGIATAETGTYLKAMLNELGDSGSDVTEVLVEQTGMSFAQLTEQGYSLGDVMAILGDSVNNNAGAFNELWSSSEAGIGALSIMNSGAERYNSVLDAMQNSTGAASAAFDKMAATSGFAEQRMMNSAQNLSIAFGEDLAASMEGVYSVSTQMLNGLTLIVTKAPLVTAVVVGGVAALSTLTVGVTAYTVATKYGAVVTAAFTNAMNTNPIILVATAVVGLTAALVTFRANAEETVNEYDNLTYASQRQHDELEALKAEYESVCATYGEASYQAQELAWNVEELEAKYESSKQTMDEYRMNFDAAMKEYDDMVAKHKEAEQAAELESQKILSLAYRLETLTSKSELTVAEQGELKAVFDALNEAVPDLTISYDDLANSVPGAVDAVVALAEAEAKQRNIETNNDLLIEKLEARTKLEQKLTEATEEQEGAYNKLIEKEQAYAAWQKNHEQLTPTLEGVKDAEYSSSITQLKREYSEFSDDVADATRRYEENEQEIARLSEEMAIALGIPVESAENYSNIESTISSTVQQVQTLAEAYNGAYEAAYESFSKQFGLFDEVEIDTEATVGNMQKALNSQLAFWENYSGNISVLKDLSYTDLGMTEANYNTLMELVQKGTPEAAGMAQSIVEAYNTGNTDALTKLSDTMTQIDTAQKTVSTDIADWQTDFSSKMDAITNRMSTAMQDMNMSVQAQESAEATMAAYTASVTTGGQNAIIAARSVASQVAAALGGTGLSVNIGVTGGGKNATGYATGTANATPGWHLVGEEGPEIVYFGGGETVYTADETERMLTNPEESPFKTSVPENMAVQHKEEFVSKNDKRIVIAIEGGGEIRYSGNVDEDTVVELLTTNLKPALINILQEEIFEEGDGTYEY